MSEKEEINFSPIVEQLYEFFSHEYKKEIEELNDKLLAGNLASLEIDLVKLDKFMGFEFCDKIMNDPDLFMRAAVETLKEEFKPTTCDELKIKYEPKVVFYGSYKKVNVRDIGAKHIGKLITISGVVNNRYVQRQNIEEACMRCQLCDARFMVKCEIGSDLPIVCPECKRKALKLIESQSTFKDKQKMSLQERLDAITGAETPASIDVFLTGSLINSVLPGQSVEITGIFKLIEDVGKKSKKKEYMRYIEACYIKKLSNEFENLKITPEQEIEILKLSRLPDIKERIFASIASSISGYKEVKEAIAYQLFSGTRGKIAADGSKLRADSHILLIGDPGLAKTKLLQFAANIAPKSIYVSGKSVTGAGLTAACVKSEDGEGYVLKAGVCVLANNGAVMLDELDKVGNDDRAALHEILETQTLSVAKAGINARFDTVISVLAAANPKHSRFDPGSPPQDQFNIPSSLLSRFDLIFPILDSLDEEKDRKIVNRIRDVYLTACGGAVKEENIIKSEIPEATLRLYIAYARTHVNPRMTLEAANKINDFYIELRKLSKSSGVIPITPRQIEGLYRISESSARIRLDEKVSVKDAEDAIKLFSYVQREIMTDRTTGRIDIDILSGTPHSKVTKLNSVLAIMKNIATQYDEVEKNQVIVEAQKINIEEGECIKLIEELRISCDIYEKSHGHFRISTRQN